MEVGDPTVRPENIPRLVLGALVETSSICRTPNGRRPRICATVPAVRGTLCEVGVVVAKGKAYRCKRGLYPSKWG
jgi:hypothetical protein